MPVPDLLSAGAAPQQPAGSRWLPNSEMPTAVTGAAAVFGPMPGIASGLSQASSPASASPMSPSSSATSEPGADISRAGMRAGTSSPAPAPLPDPADASSASRSSLALAAGAPARRAASANAPCPAAERPGAPPSSESAAICRGDDGSAARSGSGSASSGTARNLFFALVLDATAHSRCTAVKPKAAFYILPKLDVKKFNITDDEQFALDLLHEKHILITRGGFNWEKPDHFRIVYLPRMGVLHEAMEDFADFLAHYRQR